MEAVQIYKTDDVARNLAAAAEREKEAAMSLPRWLPPVVKAVAVALIAVLVLADGLGRRFRSGPPGPDRTSTMAASTMQSEAKAIGPVILLGAPGAGKSTQAKAIMLHYGIPQVSTGEILRDNVARGTELGKKAKVFMDKGELVPDQLVFEVVAERLRHADCDRGFILDGFPRTVAQAEWLDKLLADEFFQKRFSVPPVVLNIDVGFDQLLRRLTGRRYCPICGRIYNVYSQPPRVANTCDVDGSKLIARKDDSEEVVSERLKAYERQTLPLIEYYRGKGRLREIDGDQAPEKVTAEVLHAIDNGNRL